MVLSAVFIPHDDAVGQDALNDAAVDVAEDLPDFLSPPQEVQPLFWLVLLSLLLILKVEPLVSQVVRVARLSGVEHSLEVFYFVEGPSGERIPAEVTVATLNRLDLQRAAIVLGHRVQRPLAQRESRSEPPQTPDCKPLLNPPNLTDLM